MKVIVCFYATTGMAQMQWLDSAREFQNERIENSNHFPNHGLNTALWGAIQSYRALSVPDSFFTRYKLKSPYFGKGELEVGLFRHKNGKAPLLVHLTGFAGTLDGTITKRNIYRFGARGYHVLTLPNPWSSEYLKQVPNHRPGDLVFEANAFLEMVESSIQVIGETNISEIQVYGESYGAFLGAIVSQIDKEKIIDGGYTLVSPPLNIKAAFKNLDLLIDTHRELWEDECSGFFNSLWIVRDHGLHMRSDEMHSFSRDCAPSLMVDMGFIRPLQETIRSVSNLYAEHKIPDQNQKQFFADLRFATAIKSFLPEAQARMGQDDLATFSHWIATQSESDRSRIRIMLAKNDFLNLNLTADQFIQLESTVSIAWLESGGHLGFIGFPSWDKVLDQHFGARIDDWPPFSTYRYFWFGLK